MAFRKKLLARANNHKLGLLLFVDFEKAFDSIEWSFIEKTLKYYNFGIDWNLSGYLGKSIL